MYGYSVPCLKLGSTGASITFFIHIVFYHHSHGNDAMTCGNAGARKVGLAALEMSSDRSAIQNPRKNGQTLIKENFVIAFPHPWQQRLL